MWREWFNFRQSDRRAILILAVAIVAMLCLRTLLPRDELRLAEMTDTVAGQLDTPIKEEPVVAIRMHRFNPNVADSLELLSVGLPPRVAHNILRYREAGGSFRQPSDLARIYGMKDTLFARVEPYIDIPTERKTMKNKVADVASLSARQSDTTRRSHPYAEYMRNKLKPGEFVELNTADTTQLMRIPGIGPVYAQMIVNYRRQLGGFHDVAQLHELEALPENIGDWVQVTEPAKEVLRINHMTLTQLRSHPYLTFYQARAIVEYRKREGNIRDIRQLLFLEGFSKADVERLRPYLSLE